MDNVAQVAPQQHVLGVFYSLETRSKSMPMLAVENNSCEQVVLPL